MRETTHKALVPTSSVNANSYTNTPYKLYSQHSVVYIVYLQDMQASHAPYTASFPAPRHIILPPLSCALGLQTKRALRHTFRNTFAPLEFSWAKQNQPGSSFGVEPTGRSHFFSDAPVDLICPRCDAEQRDTYLGS